MSLVILFEDEYLLAFSKPAQMHSVRHRESDAPCVSDFAAEHIIDSHKVSPNASDQGLVQRLDFATSGVILAAKEPSVWQRLHRKLTNDETEKTYLAIVEGRPASQIIHIPIEVRRNAKRVYWNTKQAQEAKTEVQFLRSREDLSLVRARSRHTVRHQIRAHLAAVGHPLVGDSKYGAKRELDGERDFFLHAETLRFQHPIFDKEIYLEDSSVVGDRF